MLDSKLLFYDYSLGAIVFSRNAQDSPDVQFELSQFRNRIKPFEIAVLRAVKSASEEIARTLLFYLHISYLIGIF